MIRAQANYHVRFTRDGATRDAWVELDDRGDNHRWFVYGYAGASVQETDYETSADAITALAAWVDPTQEVEATL